MWSASIAKISMSCFALFDKIQGIILHHDAEYGAQSYGLLIVISTDCSFRNCGWTAERQEGWMALMEQSEQSLIRHWNASATLSFHLIYI